MQLLKASSALVVVYLGGEAALATVPTEILNEAVYRVAAWLQGTPSSGSVINVDAPGGISVAPDPASAVKGALRGSGAMSLLARFRGEPRRKV